MDEKEMHFDGDVDLRTVPIDKISTLTDEGLKKYYDLVWAEKTDRIKTNAKNFWTKLKMFGGYAKEISIFVAAAAIIIYIGILIARM